MVTTLATMYVYLGLARGISEGNSVYSYSFAEWMGNAVIAGLPIQLWLFLILAVIFVVALGKTTFGRKLYCMGLNSHASRYLSLIHI